MANDRIVKKIVLKATLARVWSAISDSRQFGRWFGVRFEGPFVEGQLVKGKIVPTEVDEGVAREQKAFEGMGCDVEVEQIVPQRLLSFRWKPGAEPDTSPHGPKTLVVFELEAVDGGTQLTVTESGFEQLPLDKRAKVFADNEGGWAIQCTLIGKYLDAA